MTTINIATFVLLMPISGNIENGNNIYIQTVGTYGRLEEEWKVGFSTAEVRYDISLVLSDLHSKLTWHKNIAHEFSILIYNTIHTRFVLHNISLFMM